MGHSCLESYSRVLESLANTVMSRIEDVLYADSLTQEPPPSECPDSLEDAADDAGMGDTNSMTLLDFMGWNLESGGGDAETKNNNSLDSNDETDDKSPMTKPLNANSKKISYVDKIEGGMVSPTARH